MLTLIAVCLALLTVAHVAAAVFLIRALRQVERAAQAVEVTAFQAQEQVSRLGEAAQGVGSAARLLGSGWTKAATALLGMGLAYWSARRRRAEQ